MHVQTAVSLQFETFRDTVHPSDWRVEAINSTSGDVLWRSSAAPSLRNGRPSTPIS